MKNRYIIIKQKGYGPCVCTVIILEKKNYLGSSRYQKFVFYVCYSIYKPH